MDILRQIHTPTPDATTALARRLAPLLRAGDTILLEGPIGAGKSHFARALILARLPQPEDIPSPTFTLVQTYDDGIVEIWHSDLYRLSDPQEVIELGLPEAFDNAICLIEWPDRLADLAPATALRLSLSVDPAQEDQRHLTFAGQAGIWRDRVAAL